MLSQLFFQRARQVKGRSHTGHTLVGNSDFFACPLMLIHRPIGGVSHIGGLLRPKAPPFGGK